MNAPRPSPRFGLVRTEDGKTFFVPWHPFSSAAYLVPDPVRREAILQRTRLSFAWAIGMLTALGVLGLFADLPSWANLPLLALWVAEWVWWTRRYTRDLERTRYQRS